MHNVTIQIGNNRTAEPDGRLFLGDTCRVTVLGLPAGTDPGALRLAVLTPARTPVAACAAFGADFAGTLSLATAEAAAMFGQTPAGQTLRAAFTVFSADGATVFGSGFAEVVSSPMPAQYDPLPEPLGYISRDALALALAGVPAPGDSATQRDVRLSLAGLISALRGLAGCLLFAGCLHMAVPAAPAAPVVPWEDVPPDTPVDTDALRFGPKGSASYRELSAAQSWNQTNYVQKYTIGFPSAVVGNVAPYEPDFQLMSGWNQLVPANYGDYFGDAHYVLHPFELRIRGGVNAGRGNENTLGGVGRPNAALDASCFGRRLTVTGDQAFSAGCDNTVTGGRAAAFGLRLRAAAPQVMAFGADAGATNANTFVWSGVETGGAGKGWGEYIAPGRAGSFCVNPNPAEDGGDPITGFYVGNACILDSIAGTFRETTIRRASGVDQCDVSDRCANYVNAVGATAGSELVLNVPATGRRRAFSLAVEGHCNYGNIWIAGASILPLGGGSPSEAVSIASSYMTWGALFVETAPNLFAMQMYY